MNDPKSIVLSLRLVLAVFLLIFNSGFSAYAVGNSPGAIAVLKLEDEPPQAAQKLTQRIFSGEDLFGACSYYELQISAEHFGEESGANVMQVVSRKSHSRTQRCDEIEVAFYHSNNPKGSEQSFRWNAQRLLSWDDFRGPVRSGATNNIAAETSCGLAIETSLVSIAGAARVYVFNIFDKRESWVRSGFQKSDVLQHEQGHWDICEMYTRKMQAHFDAAHITGANLQREVSRIYDAVSNEYTARQERYEQETQHGTIASEQNRWSAMIAEELAASSVGKL